MLCFALTLDACITTATKTKADVRQKQPTRKFLKKMNYVALARYWDDNAEKQTIDFKGASFLTIREEEERAEITIGNGPYYGLIELKQIDDHTTQVTSFSWGYMTHRIDEWTELIRNAPE